MVLSGFRNKCPKSAGRVSYEAVRHHPAPMKAIVEAWGYGEKSSGGQQTIAALRQFGLLDGRGQSLQLVAIDADGINGRDCRTALFRKWACPNLPGRVSYFAPKPDSTIGIVKSEIVTLPIFGRVTAGRPMRRALLRAG